MSSITIRNLDEAVKNSLRLRAARVRQAMSCSFLRDTNVLSELMRERPDAGVLDWFA